MAKFAKWIGGGLGWAVGGPIGMVIGVVLGAMIDEMGPGQPVGNIGGGFGGAGGRDFGGGMGYDPRTAQGDFTASLLVLTAAVMKGDGKVLRSELEFVKKFLVTNFGEA